MRPDRHRLHWHGDGTCGECGAVVPLTSPGALLTDELVLLEHYPEDTLEAYAIEPGVYCSGSGTAPGAREVAA